MQPAQASLRDHPTLSCGSSPTRRRLLAQPEMGPVVMVVAHILRHQAFQMLFIQGDHVVKQISPTTSNPALRNTVLPGTAKGSAGWLASNVRHS